MGIPANNPPARHRIQAAMIDLAVVPCWMPMPIRVDRPPAPVMSDQEVKPPAGVPLLGSGGVTLLDLLLDGLVHLGYSRAEAEAAVAEHHHWKRIEIAPFQGTAIQILANTSLYDWLNRQRLSRPPVVVDLGANAAVIRGKRIQLPTRSAALFVDAIAAAGGGWVCKDDIGKTHSELEGTRCDRIFNKLPSEVAELIESKPGTGYRLKLAT